MKINLCRAAIAIVAACMLIGCVPVLAEEATGPETQAESKSLDEMTNDELKIAYLELQLENEQLKNELNSLQQGETVEEIKNESETKSEAETDDEPVLMNVGEFEEDIVASYNGRGVLADLHTIAETSSMTKQELVEYDYECASSEKDFYNKYKNAKFEDLNIQYLCGQYIDGLSKQYEGCETYFETNDYDTFDEYWGSGYYDRAYVIVELSEYYDLPFGDISEMKANTESMESLNEAETRNAEVDSGTVQQVQQLLNDIGFYCGSADGVSGKRTVKSIKRFQEMYGYEPVDGMIDDELVKQLETELAKKEPVSKDEEIETELEE